MVEVLAVCSVLVAVDMALWWISGDGMVDSVVMVGIDCWILQYVVLEWTVCNGFDCCCEMMVLECMVAGEICC